MRLVEVDWLLGVEELDQLELLEVCESDVADWLVEYSQLVLGLDEEVPNDVSDVVLADVVEGLERLVVLSDELELSEVVERLLADVVDRLEADVVEALDTDVVESSSELCDVVDVLEAEVVENSSEVAEVADCSAEVLVDGLDGVDGLEAVETEVVLWLDGVDGLESVETEVVESSSELCVVVLEVLSLDAVDALVTLVLLDDSSGAPRKAPWFTGTCQAPWFG